MVHGTMVQWYNGAIIPYPHTVEPSYHHTVFICQTTVVDPCNPHLLTPLSKTIVPFTMVFMTFDLKVVPSKGDQPHL